MQCSLKTVVVCRDDKLSSARLGCRRRCVPSVGHFSDHEYCRCYGLSDQRVTAIRPDHGLLQAPRAVTIATRYYRRLYTRCRCPRPYICPSRIPAPSDTCPLTRKLRSRTSAPWLGLSFRAIWLVCDAWPVQRQTYGYLPSRRSSPPLYWYQIILLGDRGTSEQLAQS